MSKLIIHITDEIKGEATAYYKGSMMECESEAILGSLDILLGLDILEADDVVIVKEDEIYAKMSDLLDIEDAYYDKALDDMDPDYAYEEIEVEGEEAE
jgi:hypothetical protein